VRCEKTSSDGGPAMIGRTDAVTFSDFGGTLVGFGAGIVSA
jgi:hypothetical protein